MKHIWITECGTVHYRKPEQAAKEFVEVVENGDTKAALDALNTFDGMTFNGNIEAWQKLGQLLDGHRKTISSALTAQDVNEDLLEALRFYANVHNYKPSPFDEEGHTNIQIDGGEIAKQAIVRAQSNIDNKTGNE